VNIGKWKAWLSGYGKEGGDAAGPVSSGAPATAHDKVFGALIMLVDDEPLALEVTQIQLEEAGFGRFITTSRPADALKMIAERRPDLLLLDLMMPELSGFDILARMEADNLLKDVPTIVVTSSGDAASRLKALELGITEFLVKPVDQTELVLRVSNTLAAKAYWQGCWAPR
jgi:DNA-binding response OmpR family regulator